MITYYDLPIWAQVIYLSLQFITFCMGVCLIPNTLKRYAVIPKFLIPLGTIVSFAALAIYSANIRSEKKETPLPDITSWLSNQTVWWGMLIILVILAYFVFSIFNDYKMQNSQITRASIKESVDKLPAGLCFYNENGRCVLINHRMNRLCHKIVGRDLQNAALFWSILQDGEVLDSVIRIDSGENPSFRLADGKVWSFTCDKLENLYQLSAVEITQVQNINDELKLKHRDLDRINQRLRQYGENVDELTRAQERLETKANIHRELGRALLVNRKYVLGSVKSEAPFSTWETIIAILRCETTIPDEDNLAMFMRAANQAGIKVDITGEFPQKNEHKNLFIKAAVECLVNAVRHAEATALCIELYSTNNINTIKYTNNGKKPDGPIVEGGGLGSLRRKATAMGGEMQIETEDDFVLIISLPKERSEDECTVL